MIRKFQQKLAREDEGEHGLIMALAPIETECNNSPMDSLDELIEGGITNKQAADIKALLQRHPNMLARKKGYTRLEEYRIETGDRKPISTRLSSVSPPERLLNKDLFQVMIDDDMEEP